MHLNQESQRSRGGFIILKVLERYEMVKAKIHQVRAVISLWEIFARRAMLDTWCAHYELLPDLIPLLVLPQSTAHQRGWQGPESLFQSTRTGEIKPVHQPPALIFSLFSARPPTWTSTSKDVVLVLLRRQLTGENISFLGCVGGSSQAHLDGNVQF